MNKQPAITPKQSGCLCCGSTEPTLSMDARIGVGFGYAALTCNGDAMWEEKPGMEYRKLWTVAKAERCAEKLPDSDWRIVLHGPLRSRTYQRHGKGKWCLIEKGDGFA